MRFPAVHRAFFPVAALALAACGGGSTSPGTFDASAMNQSVQTVNTRFSAAPVASFGAVGTHIDAALGSALIGSTSPTSALLRAGSVPMPTPTLVRSATRLAAQPRVVPGTSAFFLPSGALGKTFTWDSTTAAYTASARTGAPANGIRFILYAVDTVAGVPTYPLTELGYADVIQAVSGGAASVEVMVVAGGTTYLDYTAALSGTVTQPTYTVSGFVTDGTDRGNFTLANAFVATSSGGTLNVDWSIAVPTKSVTFTLGAGIGVSGASTSFDITSQITAPAGSVGLQGGFTSAAGGTVAVKVNGAPYATIAVAAGGDSVTATGASGAPLTPAETNVVEGVFALFKAAVDVAGHLIAPLRG